METIQITHKNAERYRRYFPEREYREALKKSFLGFGLEDGEKPLGAILATVSEDASAGITAFYVEEEARGQGYGEALLSALIDALKERSAELLSGDVAVPDGASAYAYLTCHGFLDPQPLYRVYRMSGKQLRGYLRHALDPKRNRMLFRVLQRGSGEVIPLEKCPLKLVSQMKSSLVSGYIQENDADWKMSDRKLSMLLIQKERIRSVILFNRKGRHEYMLSFLNSEEDAGMEGVYLLERALQQAAEVMEDQDLLTFAAVTEQSERLLQDFKREALPEHMPAELSVVRLYRYLKRETVFETVFHGEQEE